MRERGFNQAELVARAVAREAGVPLRARVLKKTKERPPQAGLSAAARRTNVASVYRARLPRALRGKTPAVDDGSTGAAEAAVERSSRSGRGRRSHLAGFREIE
jgi:predicted amidophosphoribosyltransferase